MEAAMQLVIGNKNYSSWSMRPWVLMKGLGLPFDELRLSFSIGFGDAFAAAVRPYSPAARVPVLIDEGFAVWDSLAIVEYLHEKFPDRGVWPAEPKARARARSVCAEMHSGFAALRSACPMNIEATLPDAGARVWAEREPVRRDVARIEAIWGDALAVSGGPFLFGTFGAADAYFAPVALRFRTYALPVIEATRAYGERLLAAPGLAAWIAEALAEHEFVAEDEPYRSAR
jgi:glutathione S-transferase